MAINDYAQYRDLITVTAFEVERRALLGYRLIEIVPASGLRTVSCRRPHPPQNGYTQPDTYEEQAGVVQEPLFLMGKLEGTVVDELRAESAALAAEKNDACGKWNEASKQLTEALTRVREKDSSIETLQAVRKVEITAAYEAKEKVRKMETDLAKLRKHVGDKTFNEALAKE